MSEIVARDAAAQAVKERADVAFRLGELYEQEGYGLMYALQNAEPLQWSKDPEKQARFLLGFNEGCEMLRVARQVAVAPEDAA